MIIDRAVVTPVTDSQVAALTKCKAFLRHQKRGFLKIVNSKEEVEKVGLFYPPDPSNLKVSTIGGSIAQSSGGPRGFKYGTTKDYVLELTVVTSDGRIMRTGSNTVKNATGYNLSQLFVGSEGTLGIVVEALLKLIPKPEVECVIMAYFDDMEDATIAVDEIIKSRIFPSTIDFMDKNSIQTVEKFYPSGLLIDKEAVLIIEIQTMLASLYYEREKISEILEKNKAVNIQISKTKTESEKIWTARRSSFGAAAKLAVNVETDDIIVPRENLVKLVKGIRQICEKYSLLACIVGHVGDGNVHPQVALDLKNEAEYNHYVSAKKEIIDLTLSLNGTLSGEHGIGLLKKEFLPKFLDDVELEYMKKIKKLFDEKNILNPGKIFDL